MGAHFLCIKDMAGLCRPFAAHALVKALKEETGLPIHFHTHDTSGVNSASVLQASEAGVDIVDLAIASMSGSTSQPNLNSIVAALRHTPRDTGLDLAALNEFSDYWEAVAAYYAPFNTAPRSGTAEVYEHEMPGGQYTNLKEQAASMGLGQRWREIARVYAEVNALLGDIVKVTPSSKVVGDMAMFLITRGLKPADVLKLEPGSIPFPGSVIDMLSGNLGQPAGGWPKRLQKVVLGNRKPIRGRPGAGLKPLNLKKVKDELSAKLKHEASVAVLPTPAFFYGLKPGEEISVDIEEGKTLFIKLSHLGDTDKDGRRVLTFELNGMPREVTITDRSVPARAKTRLKADPADPLQVAAPIPGLITSLAVNVGAKVAKGDKLLTLEAMKMQSTMYAPSHGTVDAIYAQVGNTVESKDLLIKMRK
jgi:pyruvate carboxylase